MNTDMTLARAQTAVTAITTLISSPDHGLRALRLSRMELQERPGPPAAAPPLLDRFCRDPVFLEASSLTQDIY